MKFFNLNIANYIIRFESASENLEFCPGERFTRNICNEKKSDICIRVQKGKYILPPGQVKVFEAPYVEEINGIRTEKSEMFWSVHQHRDDLFIKISLPLSEKKKTAVLKFSLNERNWDLWIYEAGKETDPMEYPLDGLILYYMTVIKGDIMIHASGINYNGHGYLFSGVSGKGKSTMARLWDSFGAQVIHDDRLIVRRKESGFVIYNTPVYNNEIPVESVLNRIFIIEHGKTNEIVPLSGAKALSMVMANCIQHNWDPAIIDRLLGTITKLCSEIPVFRLSFVPDRSVIDHILRYEPGPG